MGNYREKELYIRRSGLEIYGKLYQPDGIKESRNPLVILSHGFGSSHRTVAYYAQVFAEHGIPAFAYDFTGGGFGSRSGGRTENMSVLTEAKDLDTVLDYFLNETDFDRTRIYLFGASQGGFVSTYVAGKRPEDVAGLVLLYPAYVLQDDSRKRNPNPESGPDETDFMGVSIGRIYDTDAQSFDIYDVMPQYRGETLIIHGTADPVVPIRYSERAKDTFPHAEMIRIPGAGHGFYGRDRARAAEAAVDFVKTMGEGQNEDQCE